MDSKDTQVRERDFLFHFSLIGLVSVGNYIGDGAQGGGGGQGLDRKQMIYILRNTNCQ